MSTLYLIGVGYFLPMVIVILYALWDKHLPNGVYFPDMWMTFSLTPVLNFFIAVSLLVITPFVVLVAIVSWILEKK